MTIPRYRRAADIVLERGHVTTREAAAHFPDLQEKQVSSALTKAAGLGLIERGQREAVPDRPKAYITTYYRPGEAPRPRKTR